MVVKKDTMASHWQWCDNVFCQFDFRDSRDLRGQRAGGHLPGDLLLVFVADESAALSGDHREMRFVWVSAEATDIVTAADVPKPTHRLCAPVRDDSGRGIRA